MHKPREFYRTQVSFVVLSETPIDGEELEAILYEANEGDCVLFGTGFETDILTPLQAAEQLYGAGSEPNFFRLNDRGEDAE